ncbi:MAG: hypothetical protein APG12_00095 [Candidatus Methanofastidiosum methylothiophilum]|uniref:Uncharacterized protein n=1 Tax=Candidatus Methanofastidiosum methylothiophilum TaxID=1705564 RepID=A0A150IML1_9EURY|nr:MAG: hypothetical protein APG10_00255 [Candidatus Methanofastidiosum methylthiophilus]KYC48785.1 MAG: hypothetical protein APG11_00096 [Candidatus Methanofastidiosum methylthiophilus]KYC51433.1 MAG: hypothetical protein APG12_00095 [Candidatus Methanofastidiosum methylthiophilus]
MNKKYISLSIVLLLAISTLPTLFGQTHITPGIIIGEVDGKNECYSIKLLQSVNETLQPGQSATYYPPSGASEDCIYLLDISGSDLNCQLCDDGCIVGCADYNVTIKLKNQQEMTEPFYSCGGDSISFFYPVPGILWKEVEYIKVVNDPQTSRCGITYTWKLYSLCPCEKGKQALYPKVDIEQFAVTGGDTIIRDGKILTNFNVVPGVQQTFIQVENRGFFTQNDVKVRVMGLPQGVNVNITPGTQKIKAHNLGTYQATFEVGSNVPSGTYKITMMAYSDNGVFDTIQMDLIVP